MYHMSGYPKSGHLTKWDGLPLEKHLSFEVELPPARKLARDYQRVRGAESKLHWKPSELPTELLLKHEVIGFFVTKPDWDEPESLDSLLGTFEKSHRSIVLCLPRMDAEKNIMQFYEVKDPSKDLVMNTKLGILEPKANHRRKRQPTLLMIPCLMADLNGARIGRGGGFYDRYLAAHSEVTERVGILHSTSLIERGIPKHWIKDHDQKLSALVTEQKFQHIQSHRQS